MKVVLDPNVLIASLLSRDDGRPVDAWLVDGAYELVVCPHLLAELEEVLARPKFARIDQSAREHLVTRLRTEGLFVDDPVIAPGVTNDPEDDYLVALARAEQATYLVTGDSDLFGDSAIDVAVVTPRGLLDRLADSPRTGG